MGKNPMASESPEKIEKRRKDLVGHHLTQLATATGQKVALERVALYHRALRNIGDVQLLYAFELALQHLGDFLPSPEQLRKYAEQWRPAEKLIECGYKPPGWEPLEPGELEAMRAEFKKVAESKRWP